MPVVALVKGGHADRKTSGINRASLVESRQVVVSDSATKDGTLAEEEVLAGGWKMALGVVVALIEW